MNNSIFNHLIYKKLKDYILKNRPYIQDFEVNEITKLIKNLCS